MTLARVISEVENEQKKHNEIINSEIQNKYFPELNSTCLSACELALDYKAKKIIAYSKDGYTVRNLAKHRIFIPIIAVTPNKNLIPELSLTWGINKSLYKKFDQKVIEKSFLKNIIPFLLSNRIVNKNERIVVVYNAKNKGSIASIKI